MKSLVGSIFLQAVKDWEKPEYRSGIQEFLNSAWCSTLAEFIELDPAAIRDRLENGSYERLPIRAVYR